MKTLPLLAFICALTACFSLCEGHRRHHHGPPPAPFRPPFRPPIYFPSGYPRYPTYLDSRRRIIIVPKFPMPPKCPNKNNTVDKNNTSEATTEAPLTNATTISVDPNSTLSQAITTISPNASNVIDNSTVPPKDTTVMPTMPTSSSPGSIPDANATASPEPKPSGSTAKPTTQGNNRNMKTTILLLFLLGSAQSLPIQINHALALAPLNLVPDQATLNHLQSNQVFPSLSLIPLTQVLTLGSDLQLLNSPAGIAPGTQTFPLSLGALNGPQQHLQPQMLPVIVGQLGAQGTLLSSEELPAASPLLTGLIFQPLLQGAILPNSQINPAHNRILPAGQAKPKPAIHGNTEGPFPTPSDIDDDFGVTAPAGIQRGLRFTEETTTESP